MVSTRRRRLARTSKTEAGLFSSPQHAQADRAPADIKDPPRHQAVVYTRFNLLPQVAVAML